MPEIDWTASMQQTFEFYVVDPETWSDVSEVRDMKSCQISRDSENELLESGSFERTELIEECYIRTYLVCIQNGVTYKFPLATLLIQTPEKGYDGRKQNVSMEAYSPLIELKDSAPPYGYAVINGRPILETASDIVADNMRPPVTYVTGSDTLQSTFVSDFDKDTWLSYVTDLLSCAKHKLALDDMGRVLFAPIQDPKGMQPVWEFTDDNSSILYPDISLTRDLYGIPNVVEVLYSSDDGFKFARVENRDENSPVSIPVRGREVVHRVSNPDDLMNPTQEQIDNYAEELLIKLSSVEHTISYKHGYCPVRVGDCVLINYKRAGLTNIKAVVKSQEISCTTGCEVSEKAVFTENFHSDIVHVRNENDDSNVTWNGSVQWNSQATWNARKKLGASGLLGAGINELGANYDKSEIYDMDIKEIEREEDVEANYMNSRMTKIVRSISYLKKATDDNALSPISNDDIDEICT